MGRFRCTSTLSSRTRCYFKEFFLKRKVEDTFMDSPSLTKNCPSLTASPSKDQSKPQYFQYLPFQKIRSKPHYFQYLLLRNRKEQSISLLLKELAKAAIFLISPASCITPVFVPPESTQALVAFAAPGDSNHCNWVQWLSTICQWLSIRPEGVDDYP